MRLMEMIVVATAGVVCGYWAWRRTTRDLYYRSLRSTIRSPDITEQDYDRWVIARAAKSALAAGIGATIAWVLFTMIDSGLSQR